jgi:dienelactone hydrolase
MERSDKITKTLGAEVRRQGFSWRVLSVLREFWVPILLLLVLVAAMRWANGRDPFEREWFTLKTAGSGKVNGIAVLPKPRGVFPVVLYFYGSGGDLVRSGTQLRQFAQLGMAALGIEYCQTNQAIFDEQVVALGDWLKGRGWAQSNAVAWVGFSQGAQMTLRFLLTHPEVKPNVYVRLAGGTVAEIEKADTGKGKSDGATTAGLPASSALLVHGQDDNTFPLSDAQRVANRLRSRGVAVDFRVLQGQAHGFEPNRELVFRAAAEYCLVHLKGPDAFRNYCSLSEWEAGAQGLWIYCIMPVLWAAAWLYVKRRTREPAVAHVRHKRTRLELGLSWLAIGLVTAAVGETALQTGVPRMSITEWSLSTARRFLVRPRLLNDFNYLASDSTSLGKPLSRLLDNVELAGYNRELVNWKTEDTMYHEYVLSHLVTSKAGDDLKWRRPLWEEFYPRIRREQSPESAAEIVVRHLRERVTIADFPDAAQGAENIWRAQITNEHGFELIYVAALRSVGIPARLNPDDIAEFWTGSDWRQAPRPLITTWE